MECMIYLVVKVVPLLAYALVWTAIVTMFDF